MGVTMQGSARGDNLTLGVFATKLPQFRRTLFMCRDRVLPTKQRDDPCFEVARADTDINSEGGTLLCFLPRVLLTLSETKVKRRSLCSND